jgi:hypothetical protein
LLGIKLGHKWNHNIGRKYACGSSKRERQDELGKKYKNLNGSLQNI